MSVLYPLQHSTPPRRRTAHWVGKPRIRLAERLHAKLSEMGYESEIDCGNIRPQQGAWRTDNRLDVMRVEGSLRMRRDGCWFNFNLESWSTITEMLRHGFSVEVDGFTVSIETEARTPDGYERCGGCGLLTNTAEAACLHCGHTKAWAQPQGEELSPMERAMGKRFCDACEAFPTHGYCNLKGCPMERPQGEERS